MARSRRRQGPVSHQRIRPRGRCPRKGCREMTTIPFQDLARLHDSIRDELQAAIDDVIAASRFVGSAASRQFEAAFAIAHGRSHAVGCGSGTDALALALLALGVEPGSEVIVPSMTFVATAEAVVHAGPIPVVADVHP